MIAETTLAHRLGVTTHVSPLRMKIRRLMAVYPGQGVECMEDWLLDLANARGARSVSRVAAHTGLEGDLPDRETFSNAELVIAVCQPQNRDRPQWLRAAAELISKEDVELEELLRKARHERVERVLAELSKQALKAEPEHGFWLGINEAFSNARPFSDTLIHWTRLTTKKAGPHARFTRHPERPLAK